MIHGVTKIRHFAINGKSYDYSLRKSKRAKYYRINLHPDGKIELVIPKYGTIRQGLIFLNQKKEWILNNLDKLKKRIDEAGEFQGAKWKKIMFHGNVMTVDIIHTASNKTRFFAGKHSLIFHVPEKYRNNPSSIIKILLKKESETEIKFRAGILAENMGLKYNNIRVKDQKTLWGSCSEKGNLNFNWKLIMTPPPVMDYIIIHELAHLVHPDHSPRFWNLVSCFCPRFHRHKTWLRNNNHILRV